MEKKICLDTSAQANQVNAFFTIIIIITKNLLYMEGGNC